MPTTVEHDQGRNQLHLKFNSEMDRIIASTVQFAHNGVINLAADGEPISITILEYYTNPDWPLTEELVNQYGLGKHLEDLRIVWEAFFSPPGYSIKLIKYEGPDGNEIVYRPDGD